MGRPSQLGQAKPSRVGPKSSHKTGSLNKVGQTGPTTWVGLEQVQPTPEFNYV